MTFGTAIVDPPWAYRKLRANATGGYGKSSGYATDVYDTLTVDELAELPVRDIVSNVLLLWTTGPHMPAALQLVNAWGFQYITLAYWHKTTKAGVLDTLSGERVYRPHMGVGYWFRGDTEPIVVAKKPGTPSYRTGERATFVSAVRGHSAKPDTLHHLAEKHFPGPYLELFARRHYPGWTCLGNELDEGKDIRDAMKDLA